MGKGMGIEKEIDPGTSEEEFRSNFATLRHMELAKGCKLEGWVWFTFFDNEE